MADKRKTFLEGVQSHIKSSEARDFVACELNDHIDSAKERIMKSGKTELEAEEEAVKQMGNPAKLGMDFNNIHRPKVDWWLAGLLLITVSFSLLPMFTWNVDGSPWLMKKVITIFLGLFVAFGLMMLDYRKIFRYQWLFLGLGVLILLWLILWPVQYINGAPSVYVGPLSIESIMALPFLYLGWSILFSREGFKMWKAAILFIGTAFLFLMSVNLSVVFIYSIMVFVMMWGSRMELKKKTAVSASAFLVAAVYGFLFVTATQEYQQARLLAYLNPARFADSGGYMYLRLKETFSQAGWFGQFGKQEFIPAGHTDFVFASITYQFGWITGLILFIVLLSLMGRMVIVISKVKDPFGKMLILGSVTLFSVQFLYNVGMLLGLLPLTGISLPFISYGLMPTLLNSIVVGIVLSVYRRKDLIGEVV
ncbi:FtsW/RodA/SpoVE family cell cycle protein [Bacillus salacetis]|uniref:FtsW/RodA/SpoVE family cell cycle protein n=1 Tax=Bacillus salacetis TaxID=2315464 RepID=A0A3A1QPP7_9BACI|nr:FtsW/RodA/SpoVE family cell cycle protein [Bacillus salacetis]RIW29043.1 FtsW/RodA/SpoVE family cell cycle protein [Bacillus salacetis]